MRFENKVAVVTGASKGIGEATAGLFLREGARVGLLDVDASGEALAAEHGDRALFVRCDVSKGGEVASAFSRLLEHFGGVDLLVNNAGIQAYGTVTSTTEEEWDRVLAINLKSAFLCAHHALPSMLERGAGVVVNVSSVQGFITQENVAAYSTSKTAMLGLTRTIAVDYAPKIRCVAVCPGSVDTPMLRWSINQAPDPRALEDVLNAMHPLDRIARPEEVAELIAFLCSDQAGFITGQAYRIDGGLGLSIPGTVKK